MPAASASKKVIVEFPDDLLQRTEDAASKLSTDRSKLIRSAVEQFLATQSRAELEQSLAEGYAANAEFDRRISLEFGSVDSENI